MAMQYLKYDGTLADILDQLLSEGEMSTLTNALQVAAEKFDDNVQLFEAEAVKIDEHMAEHPDAVVLMTGGAARGFAEQFRRQAADTRRLLERVQGANDEDEAAA